MLDTLALPDDGQLSYDRHVPSILTLLEALPASARPHATFKQGLVVKCSASHVVGVLLPPTGPALNNFANYRADNQEQFDGWEVVGHEFYGQVEAVHLMAPWA